MTLIIIFQIIACAFVVIPQLFPNSICTYPFNPQFVPKLPYIIQYYDVFPTNKPQ